MPGLLKSSAKCPLCGNGLAALVDESSLEGVRREYYHERTTGFRSRRPRCVKWFSDKADAAAERDGLELHRGRQ